MFFIGYHLRPEYTPHPDSVNYDKDRELFQIFNLD